MTTDAQLLRQYVEQGSEPAFEELVARYVNLVFSAALRQVSGDRELARDVAQTTFTALAKKAGSLPQDVVLGGWLYRHTSFVARQTVRGERRRRAREEKAALMEPMTQDPQPEWEQLTPLLDEAMGRLGTNDRDAIVLRYFERRELRDVGAALGTSEEAAKKRVSRAIEKLRAFFKRRGLDLSSTTLAALLAANAVSAAPPGLTAALSSAALAGAAATGTGAGLLFWKFMVITKLKMAVSGAVVLAGLAVVQHQALQALRQENQALQGQQLELEKLRADNTRLAQVQADAKELARLQAEHLELLRLRGQVGGLKRQLSEAQQARARDAAALGEKPLTDAQEQQKQMAIAKMIYAKNWMLAWHLYASEHHDQFPTNFEEATSFLPASSRDQPNLTTDQFEILYQGAKTNVLEPNKTIVLREKEATQSLDGGWHRAYAFADGHSEIHKADNGDFAPWEAEHIQKPAAP